MRFAAGCREGHTEIVSVQHIISFLLLASSCFFTITNSFIIIPLAATRQFTVAVAAAKNI
jgi:hypothetical protein